MHISVKPLFQNKLFLVDKPCLVVLQQPRHVKRSLQMTSWMSNLNKDNNAMETILLYKIHKAMITMLLDINR